MGRSVMDTYLGTRPPSELEINRMLIGQQQTAAMFGEGYIPMTAATVYTDNSLIEVFKQGAVDGGDLMDQLEVIRYTQANIYELSRRSTVIMASMPAAEFSSLMEYKVRSNNITDREIKLASKYHTGIDYGPNKSISVHVDHLVEEVPTEEERLNIAYNNQLLNLMIKHELEE